MDYPQRDFTHDEVVKMLSGARRFVTPHLDYAVGGCECSDCERHHGSYLTVGGIAWERPQLVPQPWDVRPARARAA